MVALRKWLDTRREALHRRELSKPALWGWHYVVCYTSVFLVMALAVFSTFLVLDKTLIVTPDGLSQHVKALTYFGQWLRDIFRTLLSEGRLVIPEYNFSLGLGGDVLNTLHYYAFGDPLNLLAAIVPTKYCHYLYSLLIVFRLYLSGLTFSWYCAKRGHRNRYALLAGALIYALSSFGLVALRHAYFLNPLYQLPLVLLGVELVLEKKRPYLLIFSVALSALSNFYFFYMIVLMTVIYVIVRLVQLYRKQFRHAWWPLIKIGIGSVAGVLVAAVILLPVIVAFLSDDRISAQVSVPLLYTGEYYMKSLIYFIRPGEMAKWSLGGFSIVSLFTVFLLFRERKKHLGLKILFLMGTLFYLIPHIGNAFNGFSYPINRWCFAYAMIVAYILVVMWPNMATLTKSEGRALLIATAVYGGLCLIINPARALQYFFISLFAGVCLVGLLLLRAGEERGKLVRTAQRGIVLTVCITVAVNAFILYSPLTGNYANSFVDRNKLVSITQSGPDRFIQQQEKDGKGLGMTRYTTGNETPKNVALVYYTHGTQYYWSLSNPHLAQFREEMNLRENMPHDHYGFDDRTALNALASVQWFADTDPYTPYGYNKIGHKQTLSVYENEYALPIGYTYNGYLTREQYDSLTAIEKQEALLQGVLLENALEAYPAVSPTLTAQDLPFVAVPDSKYVSQEGNSFVVTKDGAVMTLLLEKGLENSETYLCFDNLQYTGLSAYELYTSDDPTNDPNNVYPDSYWNALTSVERYNLEYNDKKWEETAYHKFTVTGERSNGKVSKNFEYYTPEYSWYTNRHSFDINLGYSEEAVQKITIKFPKIGTYTFDSLTVVCQPMTDYKQQVSALGEEVLEKVAFDNDVLTGNITVDQPKLLCLSIPYSEGWTAYVDGKPATLHQANTMYMALALDAGAHEIRLEYQTPYLREGVLVSLVSLLGVAVFAVIYETVRRKRKGV